MSQECFELIGGLGVGAAIHYYRELARAHDALHVPMNLAMVHADMPRMVRWAEANDAESMARYVAGLTARLQDLRGASRCHAAPLHPGTGADFSFAVGEPPGGGQ